MKVNISYMRSYVIVDIHSFIDGTNMFSYQMVHFVGHIFTALLYSEDYPGHHLDHLKEMEITSFDNFAPEMEFVKPIMAKSHLLKIAQIELDEFVYIDEEVKMFQDLATISTCITNSQVHYRTP